MKITIKDENGNDIDIQICRNKYGTVYFRRVPYTSKNPTEKQIEVRYRFAKGAFESFNLDRDKMIEKIREQFRDYIGNSEKENELYEMIKRLYPKDADYIIKFFSSLIK